jgi:hypothetical protein
VDSVLIRQHLRNRWIKLRNSSNMTIQQAVSQFLAEKKFS